MRDLISRQAAVDICNYAIDLWHGQLGEGIVIAVRKRIEELPSAQPEPCKDAVSREAAIDVAENAFSRGLLASPDIRRLPSAQPDTKAQLPGEGTTFDLISRQEAIDALDKRFDSVPMEQTTEILMLRKDLRELPSAEPETATVIIRNSIDGWTMWYACDACGVSIGYKDRYCRNCGRKLKHEK